MNHINTERIIIDERAQQALSSMLETLKNEGKFIRINSSKLSSWIIYFFFEENFKKEKEKIISAHFNTKEYLKGLASKIDVQEEAEGILIEALTQIQKNKSKTKNVQKTKKESFEKEG